MKILVTGVGGPTPRSFAIALKKYSAYKNFELIGTDINPLSIGLYQEDLFSKSYVVPKCNDINYWKRIEAIIKDNEIEIAIILPELEVIEWSKRKEEGKLSCKALLPDAIMAELLFDKAKMTNILMKGGNVPLSVEFSRNVIDLKNVWNTLGFPFWVRSTSGTSGLGSLKVENEDGLKNWVQINQGITRFLASQFLPGRNLACKLLYYNGKLIRAACAERVNYIMAKVAPSGITGNTSFGRLLNEPAIVEVAKQSMEDLFVFAKASRHGFYTVDFKEDEDGKPYITEINVRHVAFTQCFAAAGANFAEDTIRLLDEDKSFDTHFHAYEFETGQIFLRDVDTLPILMMECDLLKNVSL